jgi:hypothetical protein
MDADVNEAPAGGTDAQLIAAAAGRVSDSAGSLVGEVAALRQQLAVTEERRRRGALALWLVSAGFALDIALTITMAFVVAGLVHTNRAVQQSLAQNYVTTQQQAQTRVRVLCPLYTLLLASVDPAKRTALPPTQRLVYDHTVQVIKDGYLTLGCTPALPSAVSSGSSTR